MEKVMIVDEIKAVKVTLLACYCLETGNGNKGLISFCKPFLTIINPNERSQVQKHAAL